MLGKASALLVELSAKVTGWPRHCTDKESTADPSWHDGHRQTSSWWRPERRNPGSNLSAWHWQLLAPVPSCGWVRPSQLDIRTAGLVFEGNKNRPGTHTHEVGPWPRRWLEFLSKIWTHKGHAQESGLHECGRPAGMLERAPSRNTIGDVHLAHPPLRGCCAAVGGGVPAVGPTSIRRVEECGSGTPLRAAGACLGVHLSSATTASGA